jgi:biopolymer transport protein ExbD
MIDVTFQLLLFFVLACEFRAVEGRIPGSLPKSGGDQRDEIVPLEPDPIRVVVARSIDRESVLYRIGLTRKPLAGPQELYERLMGVRRQLTTAVPVVIQPERDVPWKFVVEAFNQARRAEFRKIGFAPART